MRMACLQWIRIACVALLTSTGACAAEADVDDALSQTDSIRGGTLASDYPEAVLLTASSGGESFSCSGAIIAPRLVLTAGHCVFGLDTFEVTAPFAGYQEARSTKGLVFDYNDSSGSISPDLHDVGLLVLETPIALDSYPEVSTSRVQEGAEVVAIGRKQDGDDSQRAMFATQPLKLKDGAAGGFPLHYEVDPLVEKGDSGGPAVLKDTHTIVAVISGFDDIGTMLARLDLVAGFIRQHLDAGADPGAQPGPGAGGGSCDDTPPDDRFTCRQQAIEWHKCGEPWMQGFCSRSCGRC